MCVCRGDGDSCSCSHAVHGRGTCACVPVCVCANRALHYSASAAVFPPNHPPPSPHQPQFSRQHNVLIRHVAALFVTLAVPARMRKWWVASLPVSCFIALWRIVCVWVHWWDMGMSDFLFDIFMLLGLFCSWLFQRELFSFLIKRSCAHQCTTWLGQYRGENRSPKCCFIDQITKKMSE